MFSKCWEFGGDGFIHYFKTFSIWTRRVKEGTASSEDVQNLAFINTHFRPILHLIGELQRYLQAVDSSIWRYRTGYSDTLEYIRPDYPELIQWIKSACFHYAEFISRIQQNQFPKWFGFIISYFKMIRILVKLIELDKSRINGFGLRDSLPKIESRWSEKIPCLTPTLEECLPLE